MIDLWPTVSAIIVAVVLAVGGAFVRLLPTQGRLARELTTLHELAAIAPTERIRSRLEMLAAIKADDYSRRALTGMSIMPIAVSGVALAVLIMAGSCAITIINGTARPDDFSWWLDFVILPSVGIVFMSIVSAILVKLDRVRDKAAVSRLDETAAKLQPLVARTSARTLPRPPRLRVDVRPRAARGLHARSRRQP